MKMPFIRQKITSFELVTLRTSGMRGETEYEILMQGDEVEIVQYGLRYADGKDERVVERRAVCRWESMLKLLNDCNVLAWDGFHGAHPKGVLDGTMFSLTAVVNDGQRIRAEGSENFPPHYREFMSALREMLTSAEQA